MHNLPELFKPVFEYMKLHVDPKFTLDKCGVLIQFDGSEIVELFNPANASKYDYTIFTIYGTDGVEATALVDIEEDNPMFSSFEDLFNGEFAGQCQISVNFLQDSKKSLDRNKGLN